MSILFITPQLLKDKTIIENNVDDKLLVSNIQKSQDIEIQQAIGTNLYLSLKNKIEDDDISGNYKTLLDEYIQPTLIEWSLYYSLPYFYTKIENSGLIKKDTENSIYADLSDLKYIRNDIRDSAQFYTKRLTDYLCANYELFDEYNTEDEKDEMRPNNNSYFSGIYLD